MSIENFFQAFAEGGLATAGFLVLVGYNWLQVVLGFFGRKAKSLIPFLGGIIGFLIVYRSELPGTIRLWWIPFIIDPGSIPMLTNGAYHLIRRRSTKDQQKNEE